MIDFTTYILTFLAIVAVIFYILWRDEKAKKQYLELLLSRLNEKINLLEKVKPAHYVPTRHHSIAVTMGEKSSTYQECMDYEQLQIAVRNGSTHLASKSVK